MSWQQSLLTGKLEKSTFFVKPTVSRQFQENIGNRGLPQRFLGSRAAGCGALTAARQRDKVGKHPLQLVQGLPAFGVQLDYFWH